MTDNLFEHLISVLPPLGDGNGRRYEQNGEEILSKSESLIDALAALFDSIGEGDSVVTGYYDPEEDIRDGAVDQNTGYYYLTVE